MKPPRIFAAALACLGLAVLAALAQSPAITPTSAPASAPATLTATPPHPDTPTPFSSLVPGSRILKTFDFEETKLGNFEPTPMFWSKVSDRGYPIYATGQFDHETFRTANTSFKLAIDGGSVAYQYAPPPGNRINVSPNADYYILGFTKTTPMEYARAEVSAWFADEQGKLVPGTMAHSDRYAAPISPLATASSAPAAGDWHVLHLYLPGQNNPAIKSLVLQVGLLQPQQVPGGALGKFELYRQDIKGAAWFDDIVIFQLPRLSIACPPKAAGNIFGPGQKVELDLTVSDLGRDHLSAILTIADAPGTRVLTDRWTFPVDPANPWTLRYSHPALPPGQYTATLDVLDKNTLIARRQTRFLTLAPGRAFEKAAPEFGLVATAWPVEAWNELPAILQHTGVGLVMLPAWRKDMSDDSLLRRDQPFDTLINALVRLDIHAYASFSELPSLLTDKLNEKKPATSGPSVLGPAVGGRNDTVLAMLDADPALWRPYVSFLLARYASRVDLWQLGAHGDSATDGSGGGAGDRFYSADPRYPKLYAKAYTELAGILSTPQLAIPWNALYDFDPRQYPHAVLNLKVPAIIKPAQIPTYIASFSTDPLTAATQPAATAPASAAFQNSLFTIHSSPNVIALLEPLDSRSYSRLDRLADFAQRILYARSANPRAIFIDLPMTRRTTLGNLAASSEPDELLAVYRTLVKNLGGSAYKHDLTLAPGIKAFLFERQGAGGSGGGSVIALWSDSANPAELDLPLGPTPRSIDLFGNTTPLAVEPSTGLTHLTVRGTPILLDQLDARLVELRGSFALATARIPAGLGALQTEVLLTNPFAEPLGGTLHLLPPRGWTIDPPTLFVSLAPGATLRKPVTVRYPYAEFAGPKTLNARFTQDTTGQSLDMSFPMSVSSDLVEVEGFAQIQPTPSDNGEDAGAELVLQQMITNLSSEPLSAQAYALVPGFARQQRFLLDLKPGQTTLKRFTFNLAPPRALPGALPPTPAEALGQLHGKSAAVGLRQNDGKILLTKSIPID